MPTMEWAWLIPALSFIAFPIIAIFGRFLPGKGSYLAILSIAAGFVLFWFVAIDRIDQGATGLDVFTQKWFQAGSTTLTWGIIVDPLTIVMLGSGDLRRADGSGLLHRLHEGRSPATAGTLPCTRCSPPPCLRWCWRTTSFSCTWPGSW